MKKIPAKYTWLVMPFVLTILMTFVVSGISTVKVTGVEPGFIGKWFSAWLVSWFFAYPTILIVMPVVRRIVAAIVEKP